MDLTGTGDLEARRHLEVSQRLRERRRMLGLTQKQVTSRLGRLGIASTNKSLSSLEHGAGLDVARLPELAAALDCTVTWLLGLTDDPHRWEPHPDAPCFSSARLAPPAPHPEHRAQGVEDPPPPAPLPAAEVQDAVPRPTTHPWILGPLPLEP
ncbi:MAG TPA: helix-turn-helix transcriptional regulator [Pedococcus sp.]|nr:helix-turn-helix transcriptional regulator [Pedococcus sp.]